MHNQYSYISASGSGYVTCQGSVNYYRGGFNSIGSSATVELQNGSTTTDTNNFFSLVNAGTLKFTTNNQSYYPNNHQEIWGSIIIANVVVTQTEPTSSTGYLAFNSINGTTAGSKFIAGGIYYYRGTTLPVMTTGILDLTTQQSTFYYDALANMNIDNTLSYYHLGISNQNNSTTYTKSLVSNLSIAGNLTVGMGITGTNYNAKLECGSYNLTVNGTTTIRGNLYKSGSGSVLFVGNVSILNGIVSFTGNPSVEMRNGFTSNAAASTLEFGTTGITFTTNAAQVISYGHTNVVDWRIMIGSGVTLQNTNTLYTSAAVNGVDSTSVFDNRGTYSNNSSSTPMVTGLFYANQAMNTVIYNSTAAQTIRVPDDGNYEILTLTGNPSIKTVGGSGTVNVRSTYTKNTGVTVVGTITNNP